MNVQKVALTAAILPISALTHKALIDVTVRSVCLGSMECVKVILQ